MNINPAVLLVLLVLNSHISSAQDLILKTQDGEELPITWKEQDYQNLPQDQKSKQMTDKMLKNLIKIYNSKSKSLKDVQQLDQETDIVGQDGGLQQTEVDDDFLDNFQIILDQKDANDQAPQDQPNDAVQDTNSLDDIEDQMDQQQEEQVQVGSIESEPSRQAPLSQKRKYMLYLTNTLRAKNKVGKLKLNQFLNKVAQQHSEDMADNNYLEHTNFRGEGPTQRAERYGYNGAVGQNVASAGSIYQAQTGFLSSPGHLKNAIRQDWEEMGVGVAIRGLYYYVTCMFMTKNITSTKLGQNELSSLSKRIAVVVKQQNPSLKKEDPKLSALIQQWVKKGAKGSLLQYVMQKQFFGKGMLQVIATTPYSKNLVNYLREGQPFRNRSNNLQNFGLGVEQNQSNILTHVLFY